MMIRRSTLISAATFGLAVLLVSPVLAGDEDLGSEEEMMAKWMEASSPGPHHESMKAGVGTWDIKGEWYTEPGADPIAWTGTATQELILGGRFLTQHAESPGMMGMPFEGYGLSGFDILAGKHVDTWIDNMGTIILTYQGECSDNCGKIVSYSDPYVDPMTRTEKTQRIVTEKTGDDTMTVTFFETEGEADEIKRGVIWYARSEGEG